VVVALIRVGIVSAFQADRGSSACIKMLEILAMCTVGLFTVKASSAGMVVALFARGSRRNKGHDGLEERGSARRGSVVGLSLALTFSMETA